MHRKNDNSQNVCFSVLQYSYTFTMQAITAAGIVRYCFTSLQIFSDIPAKKETHKNSRRTCSYTWRRLVGLLLAVALLLELIKNYFIYNNLTMIFFGVAIDYHFFNEFLHEL